MEDADAHPIALRRNTDAISDGLTIMSLELTIFAPEIAGAPIRARSAEFEEWALLCVPPDDAEADPATARETIES